MPHGKRSSHRGTQSVSIETLFLYKHVVSFLLYLHPVFFLVLSQGRDARDLALQAGHQDVVRELEQFVISDTPNTPTANHAERLVFTPHLVSRCPKPSACERN